jgi:hypothetical protein
MKSIVQILKEHFQNTPEEQLEKEWKELEPLNNIGPDVEEYCKTVKRLNNGKSNKNS